MEALIFLLTSSHNESPAQTPSYNLSSTLAHGQFKNFFSIQRRLETDRVTELFHRTAGKAHGKGNTDYKLFMVCIESVNVRPAVKAFVHGRSHHISFLNNIILFLVCPMPSKNLLIFIASPQRLHPLRQCRCAKLSASWQHLAF